MNKQDEKVELGNSFYVYPHHANTVLSAKEYRQILKDSEGWILAQGVIWDIIGKPLGAGMYRVSLSRRD
jgi:hypothetical protein